MSLKPSQYRWLIALSGTLCVFACIGLGRLAIGMLLPSMSAALDLSYAQMGQLSSLNFVGYLLAVVFAGGLINRLGYRTTIFAALIIISLSIMAIGFARQYISVLIFYTLTGIGSGFANIAIMALIPNWFATNIRGRATGLAVIGNGLAMSLAGKVIPFLNNMYPADGWRFSWFLISGIIFGVSAFCLIVIRNSPDEGRKKPEETRTKRVKAEVSKTTFSPALKREMIKLALVYFLFGFTHVVYLTFIVTALVSEWGFAETIAGDFWAIVGIISLISGPFFGWISDKSNRQISMSLVFLIQAISYVLIALKLPGMGLFASIGLFGLVCWAIPGIMTAIVGDIVGPKHTARFFGYVTFAFSIGQIAGPAMAGYLAELTNSFSSGFYMTSVLAGLAVVISLFVKSSNPPFSRDNK